MPNMRFSDFGRLALEFEEGTSEKPYKDVAGHWTIGKGHKLLPNESYKNLKKSDMDKLFDKDIRVREGELNHGMGLTLTQHQFDAIFILCFNIGVDRFFSSNIYKFLKKLDNMSAFQYWKKWIKITDPETGKLKVCKGLVKRRPREINLFLNNLTNIKDYKNFKEQINEI